jgi:hypothetical protein
MESLLAGRKDDGSSYRQPNLEQVLQRHQVPIL